MHCTLWLAAAVLDPYPKFVVDCRVSLFSRELSMKKITIVGLAILAVSISPALAKGKAKPKAAAVAAATTTAPTMPMIGQPTAADKALYMKNKAASGMK
jgi:hypothetical protein